MLIIVCSPWFYLPQHVQASPSVTECAENPEQEGCSEFQQGPTQDENEESNQAAPDDNGSLGWNLIKLLIALVLILGLIYGLLKFFNNRHKLFSKVKTLENLGGLSLGPNRSLQVVRIGEQVFVIGVGDSVEMMTEITDEKTKNDLLSEQHDDRMSTSALQQLIKKKADSRKKQNQSSAVQFQHLFNKELSQLKKNRKHSVHNDDTADRGDRE
nr:flagellar biosynthetic protein FliO [Thalassobacillus sp. CUG 92003]